MTTEARALLKDVTPGPWREEGPPWNKLVWSSADNRVCFMAHSNGLNDERDEATARFIAAARQLVPDLCDQIDALSARLAEVEKAFSTQCVLLTETELQLQDAEAERDRWKEAYRSVSRDLNIVVPDNSRLKAELAAAEARLAALDTEAIAALVEAFKNQTKLVEELCASVDCADGDIGGQRKAYTILGELGPCNDKAIAVIARVKGQTP
jgi:chromosome segregation ATPase